MSELKKALKNRNNRLMLVILIIGIVIIIFSSLSDNKPDTPGQDKYIGEEEQLSEILSEINGAGRVSVMISYEDYEDSDNSIGRGFSNGDTHLKPRGVIVVADGASTPSVRNDLKEAAVAVTGVGANRVCVYSR